MDSAPAAAKRRKQPRNLLQPRALAAARGRECETEGKSYQAGSDYLTFRMDCPGSTGRKRYAHFGQPFCKGPNDDTDSNPLLDDL